MNKISNNSETPKFDFSNPQYQIPGYTPEKDFEDELNYTHYAEPLVVPREKLELEKKKNKNLLIDFNITQQQLAENIISSRAYENELKKQEEMLELSRTKGMVDQLTKINNANYLDNWLENKDNFDPEKSDKRIGVIFIDMDKLKLINDIYGHGAGDQALKTLANFLKSSFRDSDICIRKGGDEFIVLCLPRDENEKFNEKEFQAGIDKIMATFPLEIIIRGKKIIIDVSYGAKVYDMLLHKCDIKNTFEEADGLLYLEKNRKKTDKPINPATILVNFLSRKRRQRLDDEAIPGSNPDIGDNYKFLSKNAQRQLEIDKAIVSERAQRVIDSYKRPTINTDNTEEEKVG